MSTADAFFSYCSLVIWCVCFRLALCTTHTHTHTGWCGSRLELQRYKEDCSSLVDRGWHTTGGCLTNGSTTQTEHFLWESHRTGGGREVSEG